MEGNKVSSLIENSAGKIVSETIVLLHFFFFFLSFCSECLETNVMDKCRELKMKVTEVTRSTLEEK